MTERQLFAFWRIALNRHNDGIAAVLGGPVHTYEARITIRNGEYLEHDWTHRNPTTEPLPAQWITLDLSKRERNNW